ncbi:MAG TPA: hypothetical protein VMR43_07700 [Variovorax sp.]|nr:hypothetical protein [Variovorax sp.]
MRGAALPGRDRLGRCEDDVDFFERLPEFLHLFRGPHWDVVGDDVRALWEGVARRVGHEVASPHGFAPLTALQIDVMQHEAARSLAWERAYRSGRLSDRMRTLLDAGANGLPIGLQVVGAMGDDARVLRAGAWLQGLLRDRVG